MKLHIGVDSQSGLAHSAVVTLANMHDKHPLPDLLHGQEERVYGDSAYASQKKLIRSKAPKAKDFTNERTRKNGDARGAGGAITGFIHHPCVQLAIRIGQLTELAQRHKAALDEFDAGLHDPFLGRVFGRTGIDLEHVPFRTLGIRPLHLGIVDAGLGDDAFGVVDDDARD
jgi:hypothetical protein